MQEAYAKAVVINGGDKVAAYKTAGYSLNMNSNSISVASDKLFNHPKISLRIEQLRDKAEEKFTITVTQRLEWLKEITEAGIAKYMDANKIERRENLAASKSAISVMNEMLGVREEESNSEPISITFSTSAPIAEIKITKHES